MSTLESISVSHINSVRDGCNFCVFSMMVRIALTNRCLKLSIVVDCFYYFDLDPKLWHSLDMHPACLYEEGNSLA